jgi:hypothetical protein
MCPVETIGHMNATPVHKDMVKIGVMVNVNGLITDVIKKKKKRKTYLAEVIELLIVRDVHKDMVEVGVMVIANGKIVSVNQKGIIIVIKGMEKKDILPHLCTWSSTIVVLEIWWLWKSKFPGKEILSILIMKPLDGKVKHQDI